MECESPSEGICFDGQAQESSAVPTIMTVTVNNEIMSTICAVCLTDFQISESTKEEGPDPLTSLNLLSCIEISVPEVSLNLCNNCISFVNEWTSAQEEISMLRSRCGQIKAKLLSLILESTLETCENDRPSPVANVLRDAVSREYSARVIVNKLEDSVASEEGDKLKCEPEESVVDITIVGSDELSHDSDVRIEDHLIDFSSNSEEVFQGHVSPGPSWLNPPKRPKREQKVTAALISTIVSNLTSISDRFDENSDLHRFMLRPSASMNAVTEMKSKLAKKKGLSGGPKKTYGKRRIRSQGTDESSNTYSDISDLVEIDLECPEIDNVSVKLEPVEDNDSNSQDKSYPFSDSLWSSVVPDDVKPDLVSLDRSISNQHVVDDIEINSVHLDQSIPSHRVVDDNSVNLNASMESESSTCTSTLIPVPIIDETWIKTEPPDVPPQCEAEL